MKTWRWAVGVAGSLLMLSTASCQNQALTGELTRFKELEAKRLRNIETVKAFYQHLDGFLNESERVAFMTLWAPGSRRYGGSSNESMSLEEMGPFLKGWYTAFPDLKHQLLNVVAYGDYVVVKVRYTGTQRAEFMGLQPSGKKIDCNGFHMLKIADGRIAELHFIDDELTMFTQLGRELK